MYTQNSADMAFSVNIYTLMVYMCTPRTKKKEIYSEKWKWNRFWHTEIFGLVCENSKWKNIEMQGRKKGYGQNVYTYIM